MKKILCIHGPNINLVGRCQPEVFGKETLEEINARLKKLAGEAQADIDFFQSNHQGAMIDRIQQTLEDGTAGILINPAALRHTSEALKEAVAMVGKPTIEVHLTRLGSTEFRHASLLAPVVFKQICGHGSHAYEQALHDLLRLLP